MSAFLVERRRNWSRIIGVERRGAPITTVFGLPLPDPTKLEDEDFLGTQPPRAARLHGQGRPLHLSGRWVAKGPRRLRRGIRLRPRER